MSMKSMNILCEDFIPPSKDTLHAIRMRLLISTLLVARDATSLGDAPSFGLQRWRSFRRGRSGSGCVPELLPDDAFQSLVPCRSGAPPTRPNRSLWTYRNANYLVSVPSFVRERGPTCTVCSRRAPALPAGSCPGPAPSLCVATRHPCCAPTQPPSNPLRPILRPTRKQERADESEKGSQRGVPFSSAAAHLRPQRSARPGLVPHSRPMCPAPC